MTDPLPTALTDDRLSLLKNATRLPCPLNDFAVYDRDGRMGVRFLSRSGGPTESGTEITTYDIPLEGKTPEACYFEAFKNRVPEAPMRSGEYFERTSKCGSKAPTWSIEARNGFMSDLAAIARTNANLFGGAIEKGRIMLWVFSANETREPRISLDPSELYLDLRGTGIGPGFRGWLIEDLARLSPGLFRRNFPAGCSRDWDFDDGRHRHESIRFAIPADIQRAATGHELMDSLARYEEIVAATLGQLPSKTDAFFALNPK